MPPALCPVMPGAEIPCDVRATRRYINGYDGEVFVQPAGSLMNLAAAVPGLRVFEKTLARPGVHRFSFNAWALFARFRHRRLKPKARRKCSRMPPGTISGWEIKTRLSRRSRAAP